MEYTDIKSRIKYFYEEVNSNNLIDEFPEYLDDNCMARIGESIIPVGIDGMKQHAIDVRNTYPDLSVAVTAPDNLKVLNDISLICPLLPEQQEIVRILDSLLEKEQRASYATSSKKSA
ncbi:MAG: hypothetical protein FWH52_05775 [Synergistaceae bacterium]|nr:hypothetical protein [Synergistaceae bacterium]